MTDKADWASGVLLRAIAIPNEHERIASGPGLLAKRFDINKTHDNANISIDNGLWIAKKNPDHNMQKLVQTTRIGISEGRDLLWRWYLHSSRSISKRAKGDQTPPTQSAWQPTTSSE